MSQQAIRQRARRSARETAMKRRREREERERRVIELAERIMVAIGERDAAVAVTERRAGETLRELTDREGLSLSEAVEWCGETITVREATRLRRLGTELTEEGSADRGGGRDGAQGGVRATVESSEGGGAGAGSA